MTQKVLNDVTFGEGVAQLVRGYDFFTKIPDSQISFTQLGKVGRIPLPSETKRHFEESTVFSLIVRLKHHSCSECNPLELWLSEQFVAPESFTAERNLEELWVNGNLYGSLKYYAGSELAVLASIERERFDKWFAALEKELLCLLHDDALVPESILGSEAAVTLWTRFTGGLHDNT